MCFGAFRSFSEKKRKNMVWFDPPQKLNVIQIFLPITIILEILNRCTQLSDMGVGSDWKADISSGEGRGSGCRKIAHLQCHTKVTWTFPLSSECLSSVELGGEWLYLQHAVIWLVLKNLRWSKMIFFWMCMIVRPSRFRCYNIFVVYLVVCGPIYRGEQTDRSHIGAGACECLSPVDCGRWMNFTDLSKLSYFGADQTFLTLELIGKLRVWVQPGLVPHHYIFEAKF